MADGKISELSEYADRLELAAAEITRLRSSLSTARSEGIREGLEMAAKVAQRVAESYDDGSDQRAKIGALETTP